MSVLDEAMDRFSQALDGLESALNKRLAAQKSTGELDKELSALREDRARLQRELETLKGEYAKLEEVTDEVSGRLDGTIGDLKSALNE